MNANELTFGVEIETIAPQSAVRNHGLQIGGYKRGIQVPYLPQGWTAEPDGSLRTTGSGVGCEIVSPILKGADGLAQVVTVIEALNAKGHQVNTTCGIHVHVGWKPNGVGAMTTQQLARLITIVSYLEKGLYAITGTKNRELGTYCKGVRKYGNHAKAIQESRDDRYHTLNLNNLATGRKNTVEFRCFSGSLSAVKVVGWIQVCLGIVERATEGKKAPTWAPKAPQGGWAKKGEGQSECERLMGYLAWGEGVAKLYGGKMFGLIFDGITRETIQKEFRRLARKYDGNEGGEGEM